jgi:hypothetical protein
VASRIQRNTEPYVSVYIYTQRVSWVVEMTAGDFLVLVIKTVHTEICPTLNITEGRRLETCNRSEGLLKIYEINNKQNIPDKFKV